MARPRRVSPGVTIDLPLKYIPPRIFSRYLSPSRLTATNHFARSALVPKAKHTERACLLLRAVVAFADVIREKIEYDTLRAISVNFSLHAPSFCDFSITHVVDDASLSRDSIDSAHPYAETYPETTSQCNDKTRHYARRCSRECNLCARRISLIKSRVIKSFFLSPSPSVREREREPESDIFARDSTVICRALNTSLSRELAGNA